MSEATLSLGVLASGEGTNLQALIDRVHGHDGIRIAAVGSDRPDAPALERARRAGIQTRVFSASEHRSRAERDAAMAAWLVERGVRLVVLAGYMQLLDAGFLERFPQRVINLHPALLPAFPGLRAVERALEHGVRVIGASVFFVDSGVDTGPLILQRAIDLPQDADAERARALLAPVEHDLLEEAVRLIAAGAVSIDPRNPRRVMIAR